MVMIQSGRQKGHLAQLTVSVILAAVILASCSHEESIEGNTVTLYPVFNNEIETQVITRAAADYATYSGHRQNIYAEAVSYNGDQHDSQYDASGWFLPDEQNPGRWFSRVNVHSGKSYYLYCYTSMPVDEGSMPRFTYASSSNVYLTFSGFDIITTIDPLVSTASAGKLLCSNEFLGENPSQYYPTLSDNSSDPFSFGNYNIGTVETGTFQNHPASTKVFLALDHLFAKATLSFKVSQKYNNIRTIKLIEAYITTNEGLFTGTHTYSFADREFTLDPNGDYTSRNLRIDLVGDAPTVTVDPAKVDGNGMVVLDNDTTELGWFCFLPDNDFPQLTLNVKYNVYDKDGKLIRENATATNGNILRKVTNPQKGRNYKITVNVNPSYVYVLSDDDVQVGEDNDQVQLDVEDP